MCARKLIAENIKMLIGGTIHGIYTFLEITEEGVLEINILTPQTRLEFYNANNNAFDYTRLYGFVGKHAM